MKEYIQQIIRQRGLRLSLLLIIALIFLNAILVIYYRNVIIKTSELSEQIQDIRRGINEMNSFIRQGDVGVRAYLIRQTDQLLGPFVWARDNYLKNFDFMENALVQVNYNVNNIAPAKAAVMDYMQTLQLMVDLCDRGQIEEAIAIFEEDRGLAAWHKYDPVIAAVTTFINDLNANNQAAYKRSMNLILVVQILIIIIVIPVLTIAYRKIFKDDQFRVKMFKLIHDSNRNYLYDDSKEIEAENEDVITQNLVDNLKKAASFINNITQGKYDIEWDNSGEVDKKIKELNKDNIAGELMMMRDQMIKAKKTDEIRIWTNEGLSKFADLIRRNQDDLKILSDELVSNVVEYLQAQQGGLFFLNENSKKEKYLELMGCYAYQRKKFLEKKIELGQGMVGQCFLEGETTYVTNIPDEYVNITSGLGGTNPKTLLVVPLKINEEVVGVIEIASIKEFEKYQIEFLERLAETIASSISSAKTNERTKDLLQQSQQQAEEMRAQEEEMRQNMEELQATQEQMARKNEEVENLLKQASENEESMKMQMEALEELQEEASRNMESVQKEAQDFKHMLMDVLNEIPQKIFLKDADGKIFIANKKVAEAHGLSLSELIGKSDYDLVDEKTADAWRKQELEIMKKGEDKYVFEENIGGRKTILETIKKVFKIRHLNQDGLLGIQNDITEKVALETKLKKLTEK